MSENISGSCLCGEVEYEVAGAMDDFFFCHCSRCRKGTGSAHASNMVSNTATLNWKRGKQKVKSYALPGTLHNRSFCLNCGSPLPTYEGQLLVVPAGTVDTEIDIPPTAHIYTASKANWDDHLEQVTKYDELPD